MKCPCYKENLYIHFADKLPKEEVVPVCAGTKEQGPCNCDFYSGIREMPKESIIKELIETIKEENKK